MQMLISGQYNVFSEGWNGVGIYLASGIVPSNSFERPIYVGSAEDLRKRIFYKHIPELTCGDHHNKPMRNYTLKNGIENLIWFCLELCPKEMLLDREQYWLDKLNPFADECKGFNILKIAGSHLGNKHSQETKDKMSAAHKGKKRADKEHFAKLSEIRATEYSFISPEGQLVKGKNLKKFCIDRGLSNPCMTRVRNGKAFSYKGWKKA